MLALYLFTLILSGLVSGLFARDVLAAMGYLPGFRGGLALACAGSCAYVAVQLAYFSLLRLLKPTKDAPVFFMETLSHLAVLLFVPYLLHMKVSWPHPRLASVEPLLYFAGFLTLHGLLKMVSFYAALRGRPAGRVSALGWMAATAGAAVGTYAAFSVWFAAMDAARRIELESPTYQQAGDTSAPAAPLMEGGRVEWPIVPGTGDALVFRFAPANGDKERYIYATFEVSGARTVRIARAISLSNDEWTLEKIAPEELPAEAERCALTWQSKRDSLLEKLFGLPPVLRADREILVSGPKLVGRPGAEAGPNVVLVLVEGLAAGRLAAFGSAKPSAPNLDAAVRESLLFTQAFTPIPDAAGALRCILTGLEPLTAAGTASGVPSLAEALGGKGYATAAFVELPPETRSGLEPGNGFERGFDLYNAARPPDQDSGTTLDKAAKWLASHVSERMFLVVHLRELANPDVRERYTAAAGGKAPSTPSEVYDAALAHVDSRIGRFLGELNASEAAKRMCLTVASPYGLDFDTGTAMPVAGLTEGSLRVPIVLSPPSRLRGERSHLVALHDIHGAIARLCSLGSERYDLIGDVAHEHVISVTEHPLAASYRDAIWRFTYQPAPRRVARLQHLGSRQDVSTQYPAIVERLAEEMDQYLANASPTP